VTALIAGTILALGALSFVLYPLLMSDGSAGGRDLPRSLPSDPGRNQAVDALREIEFDRETGKLSDSDYNSLKASYTRQAITDMRSSGSPACPNCGPRPESDAKFCSSCGAALHR
jgi:hypothetical protein